MDEMIERVKRAIDEEAALGEPMISLGPAVAERLARAAIAAMREPTEAMLSAALWQFGEWPNAHRIGPDAWRAMIDGALAD